MMIDYISIGCSPYDEDCAQVGSAGFRERASIEMNVYIDQLHRMFPQIEDSDLTLAIKWFPHDFGSYGEVVVKYSDANPDDEALALFLENNAPDLWDDIAKERLGLL